MAYAKITTRDHLRLVKTRTLGKEGVPAALR